MAFRACDSGRTNFRLTGHDSGRALKYGRKSSGRARFHGPSTGLPAWATDFISKHSANAAVAKKQDAPIEDVAVIVLLPVSSPPAVQRTTATASSSPRKVYTPRPPKRLVPRTSFGPAEFEVGLNSSNVGRSISTSAGAAGPSRLPSTPVSTKITPKAPSEDRAHPREVSAKCFHCNLRIVSLVVIRYQQPTVCIPGRPEIHVSCMSTVKSI